MLNKDIPQEKLEKLRLLVLDSDGVSIPRGTDIEEKVTPEYIEYRIRSKVIKDHIAEKINALKSNLTIAISSGRSLMYLQTMYGKILGGQTILQGENGNLSLINGTIIQHEHFDEAYFKKLANIRDEVRTLDIRGVEPKQAILTIHTETEFPEVYDIVKKHDTEDELHAMYNGEAFDIQRKSVTKATGIEHVMEELGISKEQIIVIGDRINDKEMVELAEIGVSADIDVLKAEYWTTGEETMPGEQLVDYLAERLL